MEEIPTCVISQKHMTKCYYCVQVELQASRNLSNGSIIAESLSIANLDIALNAMPLFHIGGLSANILAPLSVGNYFSIRIQCD